MYFSTSVRDHGPRLEGLFSTWEISDETIVVYAVLVEFKIEEHNRNERRVKKLR